MRYIAVLIAVAGLVLAAPTSHACDLVNAYIDSVSVGNEGEWVMIGDLKTGGTQNCSGSLDSVWEAIVTDQTCPSAGFWPSANRIWGNGLSGTYLIEEVNGNCVKLCKCFP